MNRWLGLALAAALSSLPLIASSAADLPDIKKRGKAIVATSGNLPPNTYVDDKNNLTGYDIEVCRLLEKALGVPIQFERLDWKGILPGLQTGRFDMVCSNVNITEERKGIFDYSIPYSRAAVVPVVRKGVTGIASYKDLAGKNVGAISGGNDGEIPARAIEKQVGAFKSFKGYPGYAEMFADMRAGRIDVIIAPDLAAADYMKKFPGEASFAGEPFQVRFVGLPMQKGSPALKAAVDATIRKARQDGTLDKLAKQFFGIDGFSKQLIDKVP
ncbi:MAG: amino acid ABC transporter substrate-binding protein [Alphaproteobacteria bacterium]|nr:amino acid ABC transporter substrate-binding protein [Alphaproteobacteria bacterium]